MRKIFAIGMFFLAISLVIGVTWGGTAHSNAPSAAPSAGPPDYRVDGANGTVVDVNLTAVETNQTIVPAAPGVTPVTYHVWTFDGTAPGPVDPRAPGRHDPLHAAQRQHDGHAALDRLPCRDDPVGEPSGAGTDHADRQLPAR